MRTSHVNRQNNDGRKKIIIKWTSYEFKHEDTGSETDKANLNYMRHKKKSPSGGRCLRIEMHRNTDRYC